MKIIKSLAVLFFTTIAVHAGTVSLAWTNSTTPTITSTKVYWGVAPAAYTNCITVPIPMNTVTVSNLVTGQRYFFAATASDGTDESDYSNEVNAKIKPGHPTNLQVITVTSP